MNVQLVKYINLLIVSFVMVLLLGQNAVFSQPKSMDEFYTLGTENGFDSKNFKPLFQDNAGYIWLSTPTVLYRWDGVKTKSFPSVRGDSTTPPPNISRMLQDTKGRIWIISGNAICQYNPIKESFVWVQFPETRPISIPKKDSGRSSVTIGTTQHQAALDFSNSGGKITLDSSGFLWVASTIFSTMRSQLWRINPQMSRATEIKPDSSVLQKLHLKEKIKNESWDYSIQDFSSNFFTDKNGVIWISMKSSILGFNPKTKQWITELNSALNDSGYEWNYRTWNVIKGTNNNVLYLLSDTQNDSKSAELLRITDYSSFRLEKVTLPIDAAYQINRIIATKNDTVWAEISNKLPYGCGIVAIDIQAAFHNNQKSLAIYSFPPEVHNYGISYGNGQLPLFDSNGQIWLSDLREVTIVFDIKNKIFTVYRKDNTDKSMRWLAHISDAMRTKTGDIWFYNYVTGTVVWNSKHKPFHVVAPENKAVNIPSFDISFISETGNGSVVFIYNEGEKYGKYNAESNNLTTFEAKLMGLHKNSPPRINSMIEDQFQHKWIHARGIHYRMDQKSNVSMKFGNQIPITPYKLSDNEAKRPKGAYSWTTIDGNINVLWSLLARIDEKDSKRLCPIGQAGDIKATDNLGNIYIVVYRGLDVYNPKSGTFKHIHFREANETILNGMRLSSWLKEDKQQKNMWMIYDDTLARYEIKSGNVTKYTLTYLDTSIYRGEISCVNVDTKGRCWVGIENGGFVLYNLQTQKIEKEFTIKNGLPSNNVHSIEIDDSNTLWIGTERGLIHFNPDVHVFQTFTAEDGLCSSEITGPSLTTRDGTMWFATPKGILHFKPSEIVRNNDIPIVVVADILNEKQNIGYFRTTSFENDEASFDYDENTFTINFAALSYRNANQNQYKYILEGHEKQWVTTTSHNRSARYVNLPPGKYVFRVLASNNDGVWNEIGSSLTIIVHPPWWQTFWMNSSYVVFGGLFLSFGYRWRVRLIRRRNEYLEDLVKERTEDLKNSLDEIQLLNESLSSKNIQVEVEREKSEQLLLNILPKTIAERLKKGEKHIADPIQEVSIFFCDIVGFTKLSEKITPAELVQKLNEIFTELDQLAKKHKLEKIKTIGDSYMAVCGIPEPNSYHTLHTAQFAFEVINNVRKYSLTNDGIPVEIRVGLHCGNVVAGIIGENKFAYDLWGDAVNMASRMEQSGTPGKIHVSEEFCLHLNQNFGSETGMQFIKRGEIEVKSKGKVGTYYLEQKLM